MQTVFANAPGDAVFRQEGDYWTIAYEGRIFRLKDIKGLGHIAVLLRHPGEDFHVLNLIAGNETPSDGNVDHYVEAVDSGLAPGLDDAGEMLGLEAKASDKRH